MDRLFSTIGMIGDTGHLIHENMRSSVDVIKTDARHLQSYQTIIMNALDPPRKYLEDLILLGYCAGSKGAPSQTYIVTDAPVFHYWMEIISLIRGRNVFVISSLNSMHTYRYINNICGIRSSLEHRFYQGLCLNGLGLAVDTQKQVGGHWVDFLFPKDNIIVEVNGTKYHSSQEAITKDAKKERILTQLGYSVMKYMDVEINDNINGCIMELKNIIKLRSLEKNI